MIDLEIIQSQIYMLQRCVDNCKSANEMVEIHSLSPLSTVKENIDAENLLHKTQQTLIGQLRLMNYQNEKLLK